MQVLDAAGHPVGTISAVNGANVVLKTDKHEVTLPATSFTVDQGKLLFGMTADQVNAAAEQATAQAAAQAAAAIAQGAQVYGQAGALAGTIDSIDDQYIAIKLTSGAVVRVPKTGVAFDGQKVVVGASAAQLEAGAAPAPQAPADGTSGS
jgi:preprotein translocase subunit YajC